MNSNETKWTAGVRRTSRGLFNYEVFSGPLSICERVTASQSPGTLSTFQQIAREHNERQELIDALQGVLNSCFVYQKLHELGPEWMREARDKARAVLSKTMEGK